MDPLLSRFGKDAVLEGDALNHLSQKMKTAELAPVPLGLLRQLEDHHQRRRAGAL